MRKMNFQSNVFSCTLFYFFLNMDGQNFLGLGTRYPDFSGLGTKFCLSVAYIIMSNNQYMIFTHLHLLVFPHFPSFNTKFSNSIMRYMNLCLFLFILLKIRTKMMEYVRIWSRMRKNEKFRVAENHVLVEQDNVGYSHCLFSMCTCCLFFIQKNFYSVHIIALEVTINLGGISWNR